ncbi:MAG: hypothetical protein R6W68_15715 [Ignavibacteriaceae bacterium]
MYTKDDENKFRNIIEDLKNLKKIEAPVGFESKLWNKINSSGTSEKKSVWSNLSLKIAPAFAVAATVVILFMIIDNNATEYTDPFMIEPEERKDLVEFSTQDLNLTEPEIEIPKEQIKEKSTVRFRKKEVADRDALTTENQLASRSESLKAEDSVLSKHIVVGSTVGDEIDGNERIISPSASVPTQQNLNFRQVQLSTEEQKEVLKLKTKALESTQRNQK